MPSTDRKYQHLGVTFLKGTLKGQINSIYKDRETKPHKLAEFRQAIAAKEITIRPAQLSPQSRAKLAELGIKV